MKIFSALFSIFFLFSAFADELNDSFSAAVQAGNVKAAADLFAKGADINFVDEEWPLFVTAVTSNDVKMAEFFIKNGVDLELKGPDGKTALLHAISLKNKQLVGMLITAGADLKAEDLNGKNALMYAAEANNAMGDWITAQEIAFIKGERELTEESYAEWAQEWLDRGGYEIVAQMAEGLGCELPDELIK